MALYGLNFTDALAKLADEWGLRMKPQAYNGKALIHTWAYRAINSQKSGIVCRYQNGSDKKDIVPFFKRNGSNWIAGIELSPRPLFGLIGWQHTQKIRPFLSLRVRKQRRPCTA